MIGDDDLSPVFGLSIDGLSFRPRNCSDRLFHDLQWSVASGKISAILGPSGSGKSSLLRLIAGLERPENGDISIAGQCVFSSNVWVPVEKRNVGLVFQDLGVFPHLNVIDNVSYGLAHLPRRERRERALEIISLLEMQDYIHRVPSELSGGQQQRVAIARSLAPKPRLLMLDEPFSSLDISFKERTLPLIRRVLVESGITTVIVTHDRSEAFQMADSVWMLDSLSGLSQISDLL